jgi:protein-disulfide isomerase
LDAQGLVSEVLDGTHAARIREDFRSGVRHDVNGTPTFFINGVRYDGDLDELLTALTNEAG